MASRKLSQPQPQPQPRPRQRQVFRMLSPTVGAARVTSRALPASYLLGLLACVLFGLAIVPGNGEFQALAIVLVVCAVFVVALLFNQQRPGHNASMTDQATPTLLLLVWAALFSMGWGALNDEGLLVSLVTPWSSGRLAQAMLLVLLCAYLPALLIARLQERAAWCDVRFGLMAGGVLLAGLMVVRASPHPAIDVWHLQQAGAQLLADGRNPYPAVAVLDTGGQLGGLVPYAYPPVQLYATLPSYVLGGDVRYAMVVAVVLTGVALRSIAHRAGAPSGLAQDAPALFVWLTPKLFFLVEQAWVDPVALAFICLAVSTLLARRPVLAAILFGLALGSKQTMFWLVPLLGLLPGFRPRLQVLALGVAAATVAPFVVLDWHAFYRANIEFVFGLPARPTALTLLNWYHLVLGGEVSPWPGFLAAAALVVIARWRLSRSLGAFAASAALTYALFFALNKIAFANYYFFVLGLSALSAAAALSRQQRPAVIADGPEPGSVVVVR